MTGGTPRRENWPQRWQALNLVHQGCSSTAEVSSRHFSYPLLPSDCFLQVVGPIASGEFTVGDYENLHDYELAKRVQVVVSALEVIVPALQATTGKPDS